MKFRYGARRFKCYRSWLWLSCLWRFFPILDWANETEFANGELLLNGLRLLRVKLLSLDITSSQHRPGGAGLFYLVGTSRCDVPAPRFPVLCGGAERSGRRDSKILRKTCKSCELRHIDALVAPHPCHSHGRGADGAARHPYPSPLEIDATAAVAQFGAGSTDSSAHEQQISSHPAPAWKRGCALALLELARPGSPRRPRLHPG